MNAPPGVARRYPWLVPLLAVVILGGVTVGIFGFAANSLLAGLCGSTEITRVTSPDGRHDAVLFEHNCGATTDFATHVSVLPAGAPLGNDAGNAFAAVSGEYGQRAAWGGPAVDVTWKADGALVISHDATSQVVYTADRANGVLIHTEALP